jgi:hypothetical protein
MANAATSMAIIEKSKRTHQAGPKCPPFAHTATGLGLEREPRIRSHVWYLKRILRQDVPKILSVRVSTPGRHPKTSGFDVAEGRI